ncbi:MAG: c-type cytochrome [Candidatus Contendobacter sp.]
MSSQVADKSFVTTFVALISALALLVTVLFMVAALVGVVGKIAPDDGARKQAAVLERIKPVAQVAFAVPKAPGTELKLSGQQVYDKVCAACHATGVTGAPKVGAKEQWEPRLAQGLDTLVTHAVTGLRAMPAKGGNPSLTEANLKDAITYMLNETGLKTGATPAPDAASAPAPTAPAAVVPTPVQPATAPIPPAPLHAVPAGVSATAPITASVPAAPLVAPQPVTEAPAAAPVPAKPTAAAVPPAPLHAVPAGVSGKPLATAPIPAPPLSAVAPPSAPAKPASATFDSHVEQLSKDQGKAAVAAPAAPN